MSGENSILYCRACHVGFLVDATGWTELTTNEQLQEAYRRVYRIKDVPLTECPQCDYDLTGNTSGICPECGTRLGDFLSFELDL